MKLEVDIHPQAYGHLQQLRKMVKQTEVKFVETMISTSRTLAALPPDELGTIHAILCGKETVDEEVQLAIGVYAALLKATDDEKNTIAAILNPYVED